MAQTFKLNVNMGSTHIRDISLTTGMIMGSDARSDAHGHHMSLDVPAVMEILRAVSSGACTADEARATLSRCVTQIRKQLNAEHDEMLWLMEEPRPRGTGRRPVDRRAVYAISSEHEPKIIKIGVAGDVAARLNNLQTASSSKLVVRWTTGGPHGPRRWTENGTLSDCNRGVPLEEGLHKVFSGRRMSGEWFDFRDTEDPVAVIREACADVLADLEEWEAFPE
ncbi:GIY-YIG nuclease family protein [Streptomyces sp. NPDC006544]|uniref:GIY-YIG nuclease family protein n=1 Tax=Streptomyces sp. NPDC006544 TaxID=3154583 RepID=UPI0033B4182F